jgi:hypothetical protein
VSTHTDNEPSGTDLDLDRLRKLLQSHDWYYEYSDDHLYWHQGHREWIEIQALRESLAARGVNTDDLLEQYRPK